MTEQNQKTLYEHFKKLSKEGITDIVRNKAKRNAQEILNSFPQFEKPIVKPIEKPKETKPVEVK